MTEEYSLDRILFIDIETVPLFSVYQEMPDQYRKLWDKKAERITQKEGMLPEEIYERAGIYAEFGKVICIGAGFFREEEFRVKAYYGDDEQVILIEFAELLDQYYPPEKHALCAHNGKEFDFPYLIRRMIVHGIHLPRILNLSGKKPWEVPLLDTMEMWKFGDFKNFTSLELLVTILGIPSPKDDLRGSDIAGVYWKDHDFGRITAYCMKDVVAVAQVYLRLRGLPLIQPERIFKIN